MSRFKPNSLLPISECLKESSKYSISNIYTKKLEQQHIWCKIFCKEFCAKDAIDLCHKENNIFCKNNCTKYCFHIGPVLVKSAK